MYTATSSSRPYRRDLLEFIKRELELYDGLD